MPFFRSTDEAAMDWNRIEGKLEAGGNRQGDRFVVSKPALAIAAVRPIDQSCAAHAEPSGSA
jgi:hypothetical protein